MKIKDISNDERPRERLKKHGAEVLSSSELLAIILGQGSKKENVIVMANKLLMNYNLDVLSKLRISELKKNFGIGEAKACQIVACFELGRRSVSFNYDKKIVINSAEDIGKLFLPKMSHLKKENFRVVYLDSRKRAIKEETIFIGSLNASVVHPREIFEPAITEGVAAIILLHNHPSGDPTPSEDDLEITKQIVSSGKILGIEVLDHVIIGRNSYYSMRECEKSIFEK